MRLGVLVSGSGTNLQALLDAEADGSLAGSVRVVISNKPGVASTVISHRDHASREDFDRALVAALRAHGAAAEAGL